MFQRLECVRGCSVSEAEHDGKWNCATLLYLSGTVQTPCVLIVYQKYICFYKNISCFIEKQKKIFRKKIRKIFRISVSIKNISCQKSDGDLVGLSSYEEAGPVGHVAARVSVAGYFSSETAQDSLKFSMVPCKQTSAPTSPNNFINFKESDSNGNDIRKVNNFGDIYIYTF